MTRRTRIICWIVFVVAIVAGIVWWQYAKLSKGLRTMPVGDAGEILIGALSGRVLAPGVDGTQPTVQGTEPLLDQYHDNPKLAHQRYLLVMTWVYASQMFKAIGSDPQYEGQMMSSNGVEGIPQKERVDGLGKPYCIFRGTDRMTFLSGAGNALNCELLRQTATQAASRSRDSRLTREGELLVTVYRLGETVPTTRFD
jgi:hypothetical protein